MAKQAKTQTVADQKPDKRPEPALERRMVLVSHGQGQVRHPESDRRLKKNRDR